MVEGGASGALNGKRILQKGLPGHRFVILEGSFFRMRNALVWPCPLLINDADTESLFYGHS